MQLKLTFDNNGNPFDFVCMNNKSNILERDKLILTFDGLDIIYKKYRNMINLLNNVKDQSFIVDKYTGSEYTILTHTVYIKGFQYVFDFALEPRSKSKEKPNILFSQDTYTFNECEIDASTYNIKYDFNYYYDRLSFEDAKQLEELVNLLIEEKTLEKRKLQKFKDMLIRNTDVLGILTSIILKILGD